MGEQLAQKLRASARRLGFAHVGIAPAVDSSGFPKLLQWIAAGYAGEMHYLPGRVEAYRHPRSILDGVKSLVMLTFDYRTIEPKAIQPGEGRIARYAWGAVDYHDVLHSRLRELIREIQELDDGIHARGVVDTAPLLEREVAELAGLGWIGKNTLLLRRDAGSYFFLAALLLDCELPYDQAQQADYCGNCTACLDACPTQAFPQAYVLDASRCISYLTIEHRSPIPLELRAGIGDWIFGCDVCQDVCPWNRMSPSVPERDFQPLDVHTPTMLDEILGLDDAAFRERYRSTPLWRPRRRGLLRNAAIAAGNGPRETLVGPLAVALHDSEPLVRGAAAWALGRHRRWPASAAALGERRRLEADPNVLAEIDLALDGAELAGGSSQG